MTAKKLNPGVAAMLDNEQAALLFIGDQFLFRSRTHEGEVSYKFVSPASVRAAFSNETIDTGWLSGVKRWGIGRRGEWSVVFIPAGRRKLLLTGLPGRQAGHKSETEIELPLPALVFLVYGDELYVWAVKKEFDPAARAWKAPFPNVYNDGKVCLGGNSIRGRSALEAIEVYWTSAFNGDLASGHSHSFPNDVREMWRVVAERDCKRYPSTDLVSAGGTVNEVVMSIVRPR